MKFPLLLLYRVWRDSVPFKTFLRWGRINHRLFILWLLLSLGLHYLSTLGFRSLHIFHSLRVVTFVLAWVQWLFKLPLSLKIYSTQLNVDRWFKLCFLLEGIFNPFGLVIMRYLLFYLPVQSWESKREIDLLSKTYYLKNAFPPIQEIDRKLLVVSNLSFSYMRIPSLLMKVHRYLSKKELLLRKWESYLVNREDTRIVKNINLSLASNRFIAIVGKNGSGKSTIAKIIVNLLSTYEGQVIWAGRELQNISVKSFARSVSYIPQHSIIYHNISLFEFISIGFFPREGFLRKKLKKEEKDAQVMKILKELQLEKEAFKSVYSLSGGNKQKAIIARSIIQGAKIIVLDEPLNFLDIKNKILVLEYLKYLQLNHGVTIIMIHHDIEEIKHYLDEIVIIDSGFIDKHIRLNNLDK